MPASFVTFRTVCGSFLWIFQNFMRRREKKFHSPFKMFSGVRCVPRESFLSPQFLNVHTDCSLLYFTYLSYRYSNKSSSKHKHIGLSTIACVVVFLQTFFLQCMDVESNPGPIYPDTERKSRHLRDERRRSLDNDTADVWTDKRSASETASFDQRLQQMENIQALQNDTISSLVKQCKSIQLENGQLLEDVRYLSSKCEYLEQQYAHLVNRQHETSGITHELEKQQERLETFSRRNNVRFFNVHETPNEDYKSSARKVVQLLNRFYPCKAWCLQDIERAHRIGSKQDGSNYPRTLVARLHRWADKLSILEEKESRQDMADSENIRVAADLTERQQNELARLRSEGRPAYYRNGRLFFKTNQRFSGRNFSPSTQSQRPGRHGREMQSSSYHSNVRSNSSDKEIQVSEVPSVYDTAEFPMLPRRETLAKTTTDHRHPVATSSHQSQSSDARNTTKGACNHIDSQPAIASNKSPISTSSNCENSVTNDQSDSELCTHSHSSIAKCTKVQENISTDTSEKVLNNGPCESSSPDGSAGGQSVFVPAENNDTLTSPDHESSKGNESTSTQDNVHASVTGALQGPQTRSKSVSKQTQLTDCFSRSGAKSTSRCASNQSMDIPASDS